jgi:hypothetical protein
LTEWVTHYNQGRPHTSLGPGLPDPPSDWREVGPNGHRIPPVTKYAGRQCWEGCITSTD